eukprot:TRINITY_DN3935_c0_g1_i1.p1 TRINITY_DN3935_c0_g1~~TRINITY_DN3935_c0_g1_i1.p1  ORF type:complete len:323 (-),score=60.66 TRINITY_DN3935_c0_g1_i1:40-1008(-)
MVACVLRDGAVLSRITADFSAMIGGILITLATVGLHFAKYRYEKTHDFLSEDSLHFSASNVEARRYSVFVTATLAHGSIEHLLNNLLIFYGVGALALEDAMGGTMPFLLFFLISGVCSWLGNLLWLRYQHDPAGDSWVIASFIQSCGASGPIYAYALLAAWLLPSAPVPTPFAISGTAWLSLLWFAPSLLFDSRYGATVLRPAEFPRSVARFAAIFLGGWWVLAAIFPVGVSPVQFFFVYLLKTVAFKLYNAIAQRSPLFGLTTEDNACHLGAMAFGLLWLAGLAALNALPEHAAAENTLPASPVMFHLSWIYLVFRLVAQF